MTRDLCSQPILMASSDADSLLVSRIRAGESEAWNQLIQCYEGRLLAFVTTRLADRAASEDVVQETFIGFLTSLPNYNGSFSLESYLFSIAAHKLTDHLKRQGRRPALPLVCAADNSTIEPADPHQRASGLLRSAERRGLEEEALITALSEMIDGWRRRGQWQRLEVAELLFVRGMPNREVARHLGISEQAVANQKFEFLERLRNVLGRQPRVEAMFPDLRQS
ncbi:MAG TPA: sigma-70 family RNA polymerase sigma factor [Pirellulales bacterium]|nr:sigma-70 family RNA polymerase sigma factor [Pirellulales bacterium]